MLQPSTLSFIKDIKKNNNRDWFEKNKLRYENAKTDFESFVAGILNQFVKINPKLKGLEARKCTFRIYRDVRFSKNKDPYKTNMGASINEGGKKMEMAGVYVHIEPGGNSFIAGGRYMPMPPELKAIRQEIQYNTKAFKKIISEKNFKKYFGGLEEIKLKTNPKGFDKDFADIELLKYTSYIATRKLDDKTIASKNFVKELTASYKAMMPLIKFLNEAVR
ncbi:MAG TPA: DUF2461 domain-containing protein [Bacteroidia bacterium]|nr:DUF2461 domain-containing protein [Bacteroidia bacterium]HNU32179.1 DUF2461 domain-containing protein [Bacteroidia bacterium]